MNEVLDSLTPWVIILTYIGFAYVGYTWYVGRPKEKQLIPKPVSIGILIGGFVLLVLILYINFLDPQSQTGELFGL